MKARTFDMLAEMDDGEPDVEVTIIGAFGTGRLVLVEDADGKRLVRSRAHLEPLDDEAREFLKR